MPLASQATGGGAAEALAAMVATATVSAQAENSRTARAAGAIAAFAVAAVRPLRTFAAHGLPRLFDPRADPRALAKSWFSIRQG